MKEEASAYLAHIAKDGRVQTVREHAEGTAQLAADFAAGFGMQEEAGYIGQMHDIGKFSAAFQKRLLGGPRVDHSTAGAFEAQKNRKIAAAFCIAGHHSGLPDAGTRADVEGTTLLARLNRAKRGELENYDPWKAEIQPKDFMPFASDDVQELFFRIKMLYSCLVDADFLDTECFMNGAARRSKKFCVEELAQSLDDYIKPWFPPKTTLNQLRCEILETVMREGVNSHPGIFSLTVPTGGGKTAASLAFAIRHARANGLNRIIYVIPYTSIIEQTAEVFRTIVGEENVLEHHSGIEMKEDEDSLIFMKATENWDMPIVVTTAVQFFESFYKNRSTNSRKIHNVVNSVVIFDEAQMLPVPFIRPCVKIMTELVKHYGASVVLCTATQPALEPILKEFMPEADCMELCPDRLFEQSVFVRVQYRQRGLLSEEALAAELNGNKQVLCIVNSRKAAQSIYSQLDAEGSYHLSTFMYPEHRRRALEKIKKRLKDGQACRVVSTSLIEAGVDVDFPCVYRQMAGLDSMLQAGGRCNREGERDQSESIVHVFELPCGSPELFSMQIAASRYVFENFDDIAGKEAIKSYFEQLFYLKGRDALDQKKILAQISQKKFCFETIAKQFQLIGNDTRTLYIQTSDNEKEIEAATYGFASKQDFRRLGLYSVNLYDYQYQKLLQSHAVRDLENGAGVLVDTSLYSEETGLQLETETGQALFI